MARAGSSTALRATLAGLLPILLQTDAAAPVTGAGGWQGTVGLTVLHWLSLCTATPCCIRGTATRTRAASDRHGLRLKPGRQLCSPTCPPQAGRGSVGTQPHHLHSTSLGGVPMPEPPSRHAIGLPSPGEAWHCPGETPARGAVLLHALTPTGLFPWLCLCPNPPPPEKPPQDPASPLATTATATEWEQP